MTVLASRLRRADEGGFSIVEIMVTLLIMGILVGIVVVTMNISRTKAQESACKANLRTLHGSIVEYQALHRGEYPDADDYDELMLILVPDYLKHRVDCPAEGVYTYDKVLGEVTCSIGSHNP